MGDKTVTSFKSRSSSDPLNIIKIDRVTSYFCGQSKLILNINDNDHVLSGYCP